MQERQEVRKDIEYVLPEFIALPGTGIFVARNKLQDSNKTTIPFSFIQANRLVQKLNEEYGQMFFTPSSERWSSICQFLIRLEGSGNKLLSREESLHFGSDELVDSLVVYPDATKQYSSRINNPPLLPSEHPLLIDNPIIALDPTLTYTVNGGKRRPLIDFPKNLGMVKQPIPELGIPIELLSGTLLHVTPGYEYEEGIRAIARGGSHTESHKGEVREATYDTVSITHLPSLIGARAGLRLCSNKPIPARSLQNYRNILEKVFAGN